MRDLSAKLALLAAGNEAVGRLMQGEQAAALLRAALAAGLLAAAEHPATPAELAGRTGIAADLAVAVCDALWALDIFDRLDGRYQLTPGVRALMQPDAPQPLGNALEQSAAYRGLFSGMLSADRAGPSSADRLAIARAVWGAARSPVALASFALADEQMPEVRQLWESGARHLELGCGAGRDLLRVAASYSRTTVVGVDLEPSVLADVMQQARELGIAARVCVRCCDASELTDRAEYHTILWSQMFFPPAIRPATIAAIRRALKPAGYLVMPLLREAPADEAARRSPAGRQTSLSMALWRSWGLDWMPPGDVRAELEAAGFAYVRTAPHQRTAYMVLQAPVAA